MLVNQAAARSRGFTLIEMITAITVFAVMVAIAAPAFSQFIANQRIRNVAFDLMASLILARTEAITRGTAVMLKKAGSTWDQGWTVTDGVTAPIQNQQPYNSLSVTDSASVASVSYGKDGRLIGGSTKFTIASSTQASGVQQRCISIGLSGVPSSVVGSCQ
jgi:type IV fimbrial biogenesis protein FimT